MRLLLIDNYDSFTFNLYDYFLRLECKVEVIRNDAADLLSQLAQGNWDGLLLSPGPERPEKAGQLMAALDLAYALKIPTLGICLGHQAIGLKWGADLERAKLPMHGKVSEISHQGNGLFEDLPQPMSVMRYHSLILENLPSRLEATAFSPSGEIMALRDKLAPVWGVQFHPESILSPQGLSLLANWLRYLALTK
ncbi:aminodeoxychorismate/anthranilate synthase component II [Saprospira sp. CCB-QB6]|uniref:anthranilate synthase component II n=1 Tax=Saprospira sp. CCB-QB6 TaxID=3023936 RepID=UPI0023490F7C|nr:aminodeoxychorismate/anthranilate synthase component II [Saprospira sp. CCB-QB6]WCL83037.1 aminodeoxychorismate/anthranilate synthase component II [Saprospira sp. CCB-QB6]